MTPQEQEIVVKEYEKLIFFIIKKRFTKFTNSVISVEDLCHETLIRLFQSNIDINLEPKMVRSYIYKAIWWAVKRAAAKSLAIRIPDHIFMKIWNARHNDDDESKEILHNNPGCRQVLNLHGGDIKCKEYEEPYIPVTFEDLNRYILKLDEREQFIIKSRFFYERTLEAIGQDLEMTRERVRQIENKALNLIRLSIIEDNKVTKTEKNILRKLVDDDNKYVPTETYELRGLRLEIKMRRFGL